GLATDYCVFHTVKDALARGYAAVLLGDSIRADNVRPDDGRRAEAEMVRLGAVPIRRDLHAACGPCRASCAATSSSSPCCTRTFGAAGIRRPTSSTSAAA